MNLNINNRKTKTKTILAIFAVIFALVLLFGFLQIQLDYYYFMSHLIEITHQSKYITVRIKDFDFTHLTLIDCYKLIYDSYYANFSKQDFFLRDNFLHIKNHLIDLDIFLKQRYDSVISQRPLLSYSYKFFAFTLDYFSIRFNLPLFIILRFVIAIGILILIFINIFYLLQTQFTKIK